MKDKTCPGLGRASRVLPDMGPVEHRHPRFTKADLLQHFGMRPDRKGRTQMEKA